MRHEEEKKSKGYKYSGSNIIDEVAWYHIDNNAYILYPVGTKKPNELGTYDMSGNIWEFCGDWLGDYIDAPQTNPVGQDPDICVMRGGSCYNDSLLARVSYRWVLEKNSLAVASFRLVLPAEKKRD